MPHKSSTRFHTPVKKKNRKRRSYRDPLTTNLVVADASRTEKTICLAVSPSLKAYKLPGRARLFEAVQRVKEVNAQRLQTAIRQKKAEMCIRDRVYLLRASDSPAKAAIRFFSV